MTVCTFVLRPSSLTLLRTVCDIGNFDVSILATTSKHNILHLNPLQTFPFKLQKGEKPKTAYQTGPSGGSRWMMGAGGLKGFGGVIEGKADREREREWSSYVYQTMSWVPLWRQDGNYRAQTEKAWLGKKRRYSNCWVAAFNITATSRSYSVDHESRVPDQCTDTHCQGRRSHGHRQSPRQAR